MKWFRWEYLSLSLSIDTPCIVRIVMSMHMIEQC